MNQAVSLIELRPKWIQLNGWAAVEPFWVGVGFDCPHCRRENRPEHGPGHVQRLNVVFENAVDPAGLANRVFPWPPEATTGLYARHTMSRREGDAFESLTIIPPIGYLQWDGHGGFEIRNGDVLTCA